MRKTLVLAGALAALLAAIAAGCGGGGGGGGLSKEEYVSKLNAICEDFNKKQDEIGTPSSLAEVAEKGGQFVTEFDKAIAKVKELTPPDEIADDANRFIALGEQQRDLLQEVVDAAKAGDGAKAQELASKGSTLDAESDKIANELGAPACAAD